MKYSELKRILCANGCRMIREGSNHEIWYSPISELEFPVSRHNRDEAKSGTLNAIKKLAGLSHS